MLFSGARIIILDEPTSALSPPEVERLFGLLRRLREQGRSLIFISHFLDDVLAICDRVTVFRNGRAVAIAACAEVDKAWVIDRMIGAGHGELTESYLGERQLVGPIDAVVVMEAHDLTLPGAFHDVSLQVRAGEVLGIYGFMGSGQLELARALFGRVRTASGHIAINGRRRRLRSTAAARRAGIALVPESRRSMLFAQEPVFKNMTISISGASRGCCCARGRNVTSPGSGSRRCASVRPRPTGRSARCPEATSRRWRWRAGSRICRTC